MISKIKHNSIPSEVLNIIHYYRCVDITIRCNR